MKKKKWENLTHQEKIERVREDNGFVLASQDNWEEEEWGGWKFVSDMLDNPDKNGIYPTSECYRKLYEFVVSQKQKALKSQKSANDKEWRERIKKIDSWITSDFVNDEHPKVILLKDLEALLK